MHFTPRQLQRWQLLWNFDFIWNGEICKKHCIFNVNFVLAAVISSAPKWNCAPELLIVKYMIIFMYQNFKTLTKFVLLYMSQLTPYTCNTYVCITVLKNLYNMCIFGTCMLLDMLKTCVSKVDKLQFQKKQIYLIVQKQKFGVQVSSKFCIFSVDIQKDIKSFCQQIWKTVAKFCSISVHKKSVHRYVYKKFENYQTMCL